MPVPTTSNKAGPYSCNGSQTIFPFTFPIFSESDLEVTLRDVDGNETILTYGSDYLVTKSGASWENGGNVGTLTTYPSGKTITIRRVLAMTQETDYVENDPFPAELHENDHDKITMIAQQIKERADRALVFPISDPASSIGELSSVIQRKGLYLMFDAVTGKPVCVTNIIPGTVTITDFAKTVLDDPDAAAARATLDAIRESLLTADGDIIIRSGGVPARLGKRTMFYAHHSGGTQNYAAGGETVQALDTELFDETNEYNNGTYTWTVSETGIYLVGGGCQLSSVGDNRYVGIHIKKNGTTVIINNQIRNSTGAGTVDAKGSALVSLAAGNTLQSVGYNGDVSIRTGSSLPTDCYFWALRVF